LAPQAIAQQTTGAIRGLVTDTAGAPVAGATVKVTHVPTGTVSDTRTNETGSFVATGLRPGGPYTVQVARAAFQTQILDGIAVGLADPFQLTVELTSASDGQAEVVVTASRRTGSRDMSTGAASRFGSGDIDNTASIGRDLKSVFRKDPFVTIDPTNSNAVSFAGSNTRLNTITVDGVRQNDDFGLNNNGYPTQRSPISLDALETVEARVAPYSVVYDGFFGGNVNVVTKSGTNKFSGSLFYETTDDTLTGKRFQVPGSIETRDVNSNFRQTTIGASLGGPIIKDRLFFFLSYEDFQGLEPVDTGPTGSGFANSIPGINTAMVDRFRTDARARYSIDPLGVPASVDQVDTKMLAKLDWNINNNHRAVLSWQKTEGNSFGSGGGNSTNTTSPALALQSRNFDRGEILTQWRAELVSNWTDSFSTEVRIGVKETETNQIPFAGLGFAQTNVRVQQLGTLLGVSTPAAAEIRFGPDTFRHDNYLKVDTATADLRGTLELGRHTLLAGFGLEDFKFLNVFVPNSLGTYTFSSYNDFVAGTASGYSLGGALTPAQVTAGVPVAATFATARNGAASFGYRVWNAYLQDTWDVTEKLQVLGGLRYVLYTTDDGPLQNATFRSRHGFSNTATVDGRDAILPRFGFNYDLADNLTIRGGVGKYTGGSINVWLSNNFSNDGVRLVNAVCPSGSITGVTRLNAVPAGCTFTPGNGNVNLLDPNFEIPTSWKANIGAEMFLGEGDSLRLFTDLLVTEVDKAVVWKDLRAVQTGAAPDGRPRYSRSTTGTIGANGFDMMLTNTDKGDSRVFVIGAEKEFDFGLSANFSYTNTRSRDANPGTSSIALSNYENVAASNHNDLPLAISDYEIRDSWKGGLSFVRKLFGDNDTVVSLYGEHRSGLPFSYTFNGTNPGSNNAFGFRVDNIGGNVNDGISGGRSSNQLFYVPTEADIGTRVILQGISAADFNAALSRTGLDAYRGRIAPRNAFNSPWVTKFDLRLSQEFPAFFPGGAKAKAYLDIENLGNLLNDEWGVVEQPVFPRMVPVVNAAIDAQGRYVYSGALLPAARNFTAGQSVYQIKVGLRYSF
jgi:hypothetical protein